MQDQQMTYIKKSYGLLLFHKIPISNKLGIVCVKTPYSYAFGQAVMGKYNTRDVIGSITEYINNMTPEEKRLFSSFEYENLYFYIHGKTFRDVVFIEKLTPEERYEYKIYRKCYTLFQKYIYPNKNKILEIINQSYNRNIYLWQFPKGQLEPDESEIECAVREVKEETGITDDKYDILFDMKPIRDIKKRGNIVYHHIYYIGVLKDNVRFKLNFNCKKEYIEITDVKVIQLDELSSYITNAYMINEINLIKQHIKNYIKRKKTYDIRYGD